MDSETIKNSIVNLGRIDFRAVISLLLREVFHLNAISVDGTNDGGFDWQVYKDGGGSTSVAYQDTVQIQKWEEKALSDARKAVEKSGATRFYFFTPKSQSGLKLRQLENKITSELQIPATCLAAAQMSEFICESGLIHEFLDAIDAPLAAGIGGRPDQKEILLHAYSNLSSDRHNHQAEVYEESILLASYLKGPLDRDQLIKEAAHLLSCPDTRGPAFSKQIDRLMSRRQLKSVGDKKLMADEAIVSEIEDTERLYLKELAHLQGAQTALTEKFGVQWTPEDAQRASVYLSRYFVKSQVDNVALSGVTLSAPGFIKHLGDPLQDLRDQLKKAGIPPRKIAAALSELVDQAKGLPLIKKLTRAAVFVSLEGVDPVSSAKAIGAPRWTDVKTMLDASVAIPFLCARLYKPNSGSFFNASFQAVTQLMELGSKPFISWNYINECASHLLRALDYQAITEFSSELEHSQNAYVANYFRLRNQGTKVPDSISEYLSTFSRAVTSRDADKDRWVRSVMPDIQRLLGDYGVEFETIAAIPDGVKKEFQVEYAYQLNSTNRDKSPVLIDHDVVTMGHLKRQISEKRECWILLTWDRAMIAVGAKTGTCGWVVSPEVALDFTQPYKPLSEMNLCAVAHRIARLRERPESLSAAILDRIVEFAGEQLQDWEFRQKVAAFKADVISRIDVTMQDFGVLIDAETDKFLESCGIKAPTPKENQTPVA